ncbi:hypothetical protein SUGI_0750430 [Cryptomeria japonica]|uniref:11-beta-hydroxysteroid dehydrogenase n=1 Tax=Cryptomeria japonica TaxID=3369 RepID=UPI002414798D|nr:11-beta-hydroxysteroid dehydrogenase [Cryptomeria japonica]GLJ37034.1 hypothetical protein SUGI_0750430 [Cryptomeria japonica]
MDLVQMFLNLAFPPLAMFFLALALPPLALMKMCGWVYHFIFSENMQGKVVLITGSSSGIGEQMAYQYAKKGAKLVLVARREDHLKAVADKSSSIGAPAVHVIVADVSKEEDCKNFIEETIRIYGRLNHLVNNAGIAHSFLFEETVDPTRLQQVMDVTFWGSVYPTYYAIPHLKQVSGRIVVTASDAGWLPLPRMSLYNAAKAAVINFFDSLRIELGPSVGITVATPGWTESEMTRGKFINRQGDLQFNQDVRDVQLGPWPVVSAEECGKAIVNGACRGERSVSIPKWGNVLFLYRLLAPQLLEWASYLFYVRAAPQPLSKTAVDATGAKKILYPSSIRQPLKSE